jgi:predicted CXXCH cytochrome family protein
MVGGRLACGLLLALAAPAFAADGPPATGAPSGSGSPPAASAAAPATCESCHAALLRGKVVHDALSAGSCTDCHAPGDRRGRCRSSQASSWRLSAPPAELCAGCHDAAQLAGAFPVRHAPVAAGRCAECHDAHSSDRPHLVRHEGRRLCLRCHSGARPEGLARSRVDRGKHAHSGFEGDCADCHVTTHGAATAKLLQEPPPALCNRCHAPKGAARAVHEPVASGDCITCHAVHTSDAAKGLAAAPAAICATCHDAEALAPRPFAHAPAVEGGCLGCHDPHESGTPRLLRAPGREGCLACHGPAASGRWAASPRMRVDLRKRYVHLAVDAGDCTDCHVAGHSADREALLSGEPSALCHGCHDRVDAKPFVHGAVRVGDCVVCHEPHASDQPRLIAKPTVKAMCFTCHQDDLVTRPVVHAPVAEGDCKACHAPHSADGKGVLHAGSGKRACYACHAEVDGRKVKHAALRRYGCTGCHDPHGAARPALLGKKVNDLCLDCHPAITGRHVTSLVPAGHPLEGGPDPRQVERDYGCASCHEPHSTDFPRLFRSGATALQSCDGCHGNLSGTSEGGADLVRDRRDRRRKLLEQRKREAAPAAPPASERPPARATPPGDPPSRTPASP